MLPKTRDALNNIRSDNNDNDIGPVLKLAKNTPYKPSSNDKNKTLST